MQMKQVINRTKHVLYVFLTGYFNEVFEDSSKESSPTDSIRSCTTKKFMYQQQTVWTNGQELVAEIVGTPSPDL